MRAVNLLPSDLRGAAPKPARAARPEPVEGIGAFVVLGALALCVAALAGYVLAGNGVKQRTADLEAAKQHTAAATVKANALQPYADFEVLANTRVETVRGLAAARFDWEQALRDLSRAVPSDVKLTSLTGDMGLPGASGASPDPLRGSIAVPAITLVGCASSQSHVARMMARVKAVDGVTRVSLSKSVRAASVAGSTGSSAGGCGDDSPPAFSLVVFFERSTVLNELATTGTAAASSVPVPNAVSGSTPAAATTPTTSTISPTAPATSTTAASGAAPTPAPSTTPSTQPAETDSSSTTGGAP
jgi:Tfp pilus assembly protein PilN